MTEHWLHRGVSSTPCGNCGHVEREHTMSGACMEVGCECGAFVTPAHVYAEASELSIGLRLGMMLGAPVGALLAMAVGWWAVLWGPLAGFVIGTVMLWISTYRAQRPRGIET